MNLPLENWRAGFTRRWHMNPDLAHLDDPICAHQGRCAVLVITLWPDHSHDLLRAAVTHDQAESRVGDLSRPFKACGGDLVVDHAALECIQLQAMGVCVDLDGHDNDCLLLVDRLDAYLFARHRAPHVVVLPEWTAERQTLIGMAWRCNVGAKVRALVGADDG